MMKGQDAEQGVLRTLWQDAEQGVLRTFWNKLTPEEQQAYRDKWAKEGPTIKFEKKLQGMFAEQET